MSAAAPVERRPARRPRDFVLLRLLPHDSPVHRLWAGTKLLIVLGLGVMLSFRPTWPALGAAAAVVAVGVVAARVPAGAVPRLPRWVWILLLADAVLTMRSGTPPLVQVGSVDISVGALGDWALLVGLAVVILAAALLVGWTTPLGDVAPALARLTAPLRALRLPVDEWVVAVGLAIRSLPLLVEEIRTLFAVSRLRRPTTQVQMGWRRRLGTAVRDVEGLLSTAVVVALRRARDLADAIEARGGLAAPVTPSAAPGATDALVLAGVAAVIAAVLAL
ncbi:MAG TPA: energy-coupling factor transporter transmembrane protein EcfT [Acidimicrobiia bacterium]|nr:energy-coupling factor transporter transmembrane protein EcfT [Acidimicrobiia bacterium]